MRSLFYSNRIAKAFVALSLVLFVSYSTVSATDHAILQQHCGKCHTGEEPEGGFHLELLGDGVTAESQEYWQASMDYVSLGDMPPSEESNVTDADRLQIAEYIREMILKQSRTPNDRFRYPTRRLNNREFANSISDALGIEDPGTHFPLGNLLGDTLHDGFDTNGDALGISEYHLEQYVESVRKVVDATVLSGEQSPPQHYDVPARLLRMSSLGQRTTRQESAIRNEDSLEFRDMRVRMYFDNFREVPVTGYYRIKIRATGIDRGYYDSAETGVYDGDPISLAIHFGDRKRTYELPDNEVMEIELTEWLAKGTRVELSYPTDGLRNRGNGNFKFQQSIAHDHIKEHDPDLYAKVVASIKPKRGGGRVLSVSHWSHWVDYWRGPRPRVYGAEIDGPIYQTWPPKRQFSLVGESPISGDAEAILTPIAERAWRRKVREGELDPIVRLVHDLQPDIGDLEAMKEGIVAIFVSPSFLLINPEDGSPAERFATKLAYFFESTLPSERVHSSIAAGKADDFDALCDSVARYFTSGHADEFLIEFPHAWLQLDRINFMAPDPDRYPHYHRKDVSADMIAEAKHFFRHAVETNMSVPEMLTANYSFINADLAKVYGVDDVPEDSKLRKYEFADHRRGGLLGMAAFLTLTADTMGTSPIHRAVYVMENFMGIHPAPPPGDVEIQEPDVRQAKTIKEILKAHVAQETCASCHRSIDPYGYAFENFDPVGAWRDQYVQSVTEPEREAKVTNKSRKTAPPIQLPIDASATFRNGKAYDDIVGFRKLMQSKANQEQFVRCFIKKLLIYANGTEPQNAAEVEKILLKSAEHDYRIVETIAAVLDSPLFREP
ncbi:DUF1588 domain-containing protein [Aporhodopirellula aestuarii]|uniref:DUF1588 domain-containing protein n=1 Tax=Aporhodopirellula aestuarii TaxID=2950107 RepID=A0ABT0TYP3_9BACT|nr:DUF1588 domain-containing protein [Aporhodopirellula aestuarii]MCM2369722.1 DUF1588 domain-containing protein [Aporhodopirellula aestuarii]